MPPRKGLRVILNSSSVMGDIAGMIASVNAYGECLVVFPEYPMYAPVKDVHFFESKPKEQTRYWHKCWLDPRYNP